MNHQETAATGLPTIEVQLGVAPPADTAAAGRAEELRYTSSHTDESGRPALHIWKRAGDGLLHLRYYDGVEFWLDPAATRAWGTWPASSSLEDAASYLLGPVLGFALRMRGTPCLHASAVVLNGQVVAFVGDAGAGKSTTAAAFAREGEVVVSDDIVTLTERDGKFWVAPAYPYLSLWDDSVAMLYGEGKSLPTFSQNFGKRLLALGEHGLRFADKPMMFGAIFLLGEPSEEAHAPFVERIAPRECLLALVANSYATNFLEPGMRAQEFTIFGKVVGAVPAWRIWPRANSNDLHRFYTTIRAACEGRVEAAG